MRKLNYFDNIFYYRWNDNIHGWAFYNGWKSIHGLKHQTVDNAFGFTKHLYGPSSVRWYLLQDSKINNKFRDIQQGNNKQYIIFGDSAYGRDTHFTTYNTVEDLLTWNKCMKHVRISIEWNYGTAANLFKMVRRKDKLQLMKNSGRVCELYTVVTLFRNFYVACYGGQCSNYFNLELPNTMLYKYITQTDFDEEYITEADNAEKLVLF